MANPDELLLATFQLDMTSNQCGYPLCCPGTQVDSKSNTELRSYNISKEAFFDQYPSSQSKIVKGSSN